LNLKFSDLSLSNLYRARRWHKDFGPGKGDWTSADWSNAMAGEMGEAANVVKKLRRWETGHPGKNDPDYINLQLQLGEELADVVIYADLLAQYYNLDLGTEVANKFNKVSDREGLPEKLEFT
jgi:NTP pyrophosphatase (non-canonical NTP hydrolase)